MWSSTPAACSRPTSGGWPGSMCRSSRLPTNTSSPSRSPACGRTCRPCATRTTCATSARRSAACAWAATSGSLLAPDWPRFEEIMAGAVRRVPAIADAGVTRLINGPEGFTPDNEFILGESEIGGLFVAAGFCAHGIAGAGGVGRQIASWIVDGEPELDLWRMDIRRFGAQYRSPRYAQARTVEVYRTYYDIHYPNEERQAGRPLRLSPAYPRLEALGAAFGEKAGWERPNWFETNATPDLHALRPQGWAGHHWSPAIAA